MKRITLITLASLALFATAATAHQNGWVSSHFRDDRNFHQTGFNSRSCPMNTDWTNHGMIRSTAHGNTTQANSPHRWRTNPSYQGQVNEIVTTSKQNRTKRPGNIERQTTVCRSMFPQVQLSFSYADTILDKRQNIFQYFISHPVISCLHFLIRPYFNSPSPSSPS